jgi:hypothetical protein
VGRAGSRPAPKLSDNRIRRVKKASTSVVFARFRAVLKGPGP